MVNENVWFYTLSTIAQTCAAILALGGTFVIFKLDKLSSALNNYRGRVVVIVQAWRRSTKPPDKFFDESNQDILNQYRNIVSTNKEDLFDKSEITQIYIQFENVRIISPQGNGSFSMSNGVILNHEERMRWCNRMADLLEKNISFEHETYNYLKAAILFLSISIVSSIFMLGLYPQWGFNDIFYRIVVWSIFSVLFSSYAVWKIARMRPIL